MIARLVILAASVGGGLLLGRRAINKAVAKRLPEEVETAQRRAIAELDKQADEIIGERLFAFLIALIVKALIIGGFFWLHVADELTTNGFQYVATGLIGLFIARDLANILPYAAPVMKLLRGHDWRFRHAIKEFVAGVAFERAYAEALRASETGPNKAILAFSKYSAHNISEEIAEAVAQVARSVTFDLVKVRVVTAVLSALAMFGAYASFFALALSVD